MLIGVSLSAILHGLLLVGATLRQTSEARRARDEIRGPILVSLHEHERPTMASTPNSGAGDGAHGGTRAARSHSGWASRRRQAPLAAKAPSQAAISTDAATTSAPDLLAGSAGDDDSAGPSGEGLPGVPGAAPGAADGTGAGCCAAGDQKPAAPTPAPPRVAARPVLSPHPTYPRQARLMGWEGTVVLRLLVDAQGNVAQVTVVTGSGFATLDESAVDAARRWRFEPAREGGRPTAMIHEVRFRFRLDSALE